MHGPLLLRGTYIPLPQSRQGVVGLESLSDVPLRQRKLEHGPALASGTYAPDGHRTQGDRRSKSTLGLPAGQSTQTRSDVRVGARLWNCVTAQTPVTLVQKSWGEM
jgi:hypothetical protein